MIGIDKGFPKAKTEYKYCKRCAKTVFIISAILFSKLKQYMEPKELGTHIKARTRFLIHVGSYPQ